jgi:methionine-rich copper-binding protein CopC
MVSGHKPLMKTTPANWTVLTYVSSETPLPFSSAVAAHCGVRLDNPLMEAATADRTVFDKGRALIYNDFYHSYSAHSCLPTSQ